MAIHASFVITDSFVFYLVEKPVSKCSYQINQDSLVIYRKGKCISTKRIIKLTNDTLELSKDGVKQRFIKSNSPNC